MRIDRSRAFISKRGFQFVPLRPAPDAGESLEAVGLAPATELLVFERGGHKRALVMRELSYHHIAQGELGGLPYLISF